MYLQYFKDLLTTLYTQWAGMICFHFSRTYCIFCTNFSNTFHLDFSDLSWEKAKSFGSFFLVPNLAFKRGESNFIRVKVWVNNAFDPTKQGDRKATRSTKRVFSFAKGVQELVMEFLIAVICVIYWLEKWQVQFKESVKILPLWLACFLSVFSPISSTFLALMAFFMWSMFTNMFAH